MTQLFRRKPIAELVVEGDQALKRVMGAGDLIMLAIGAVIGAGIFSAIGTAAAGQIGPNGEVIRQGAGPALVFSFLLLGVACALAGLCYAELAAMIPQAGSAYAYTYATLGELVAWIIGWDLILEYAVGNVAVAISWGDYFNTLLRGFGWTLPPWLTTGYRTALLSPDPAIHGLLDSAPHLLGIPIVVHVPAFAIVMLITWLLLQGARESSTANNIMVVIKLLALALFIAVGATHLHAANYHPFAPNGFKGIHQGAAIVFFAYIGFDAISTAAEETKNPQRNLPIGILGGLAICTVIYVIVGAVLTGMVPYQQLAVADPLARAAAFRLQHGRVDCRARRRGVDVRRPARVSIRPAPDLLRDGPRRSSSALGRPAQRAEDPGHHDDRHRRRRGVLVAHRRRRRNLRPDEHRNAVRVHARVDRRAGAPLQGA
jgi:APA family basic amino acid/polyamine antiporter